MKDKGGVGRRRIERLFERGGRRSEVGGGWFVLCTMYSTVLVSCNKALGRRLFAYGAVGADYSARFERAYAAVNM
jgi:hypothetical protein